MQLPKDFIERTKTLLGSEWDEFVDALNQEPPVSIRLNSLKNNISLALESVPWCRSGYYLPTRPSFTFDPLFHAGAYYVQEASSMILEQFVEQFISSDVKCLDLCAAPGGKSTLLSGVLSKDSLIVSNEIIRSRANVLAENVYKWGNLNHIVTNNKPEDFTSLTHFFDMILVDAPCSGEGMFRKDSQAIEEWSTDNVKLCAQRQKKILQNIWDTLKPGGYLLYSTCTYNREEDEEIVDWLSHTYDATILELETQNEWNISTSKVRGKDTYHFYPHRTRGEGLYFAILQKREESIEQRKRKKNQKDKSKISITSFSHLLADAENFTLFESRGYIHAFPKMHKDDLLLLQEELNIVSQGICLGQMKGKDFIPHQSLALSLALNSQAFERVEVDWLTAIAYLRAESIQLSDAPRGIILLTYKKRPIGFVKNLGNRANNLYPSEWRIRSSNLPDKEVEVIG